MSNHHEFHALFNVICSPREGIKFGDLSRTFRNRAVRIEGAALKSVLAGLVDRGALVVVKRGRAHWYSPGPAAREVLSSVLPPHSKSIHYRADRVHTFLDFLFDSSSHLRADLVEAVKKLAVHSATGLVSLADLKRFTGLSRSRMHVAVKEHVSTGGLLLHPIAARHQATREEMEDGIKTPGGQNLFYVEVVQQGIS